MKTPRFASLAFAMSTMLTCAFATPYPPTDKQPVTDEYHGVKVVDDYRWLEESGSPAVKAWSEAQNKHTRAWLDALPDRADIEARLTALYAKDTPSHSGLVSRPGRLFALKFQPPKQQRLLVTLTSADYLASEKVVLDPNEMEPKGQVAMGWFVPSPDGKLIAVSLSEHGSEEGTLHFFRTDTGEHLPDRIARVQYPTGGGSAAWAPDGKTIFYTRYPRTGEKPAADLNFFQQIYTHKLGTPDSADVHSAGQDFPRIAEIELHSSNDGRWLLATVANGDGGEFAHYLRELKEGAAWRQVTKFEDSIKEIAFGCDGATLFLRSVKDAPRGKVLRMKINGAQRDAEVIVPASDAVIEGITPAHSFLYISGMSSMTLPPARAILSSAVTPGLKNLPSKAAATAVCSWAHSSRKTPVSPAPSLRTSVSTTCCAWNSTLTARSMSPNSAPSKTLLSSRLSTPTRRITMSLMAQSIPPSSSSPARKTGASIPPTRAK